MNRHFYRHLLPRGAKAWPPEVPADGVAQMHAPEGDDESPLSSAPSNKGREGMAPEIPVDGVARLRAPEGDDETSLLSAPSAKGREGMAARSTCGRGSTDASAGR